MIDREELRRLCEAATPGPWSLDPCKGEFGFMRSGLVWLIQRDDSVFQGSDFIQAAPRDAAFIAAARTAVPALLDALEAAEAQLLDTTWQSHADHWQKRAVAAEAREKRLRELLAIYVHAHKNGNAVPPNIEDKAKAALAKTAP